MSIFRGPDSVNSEDKGDRMTIFKILIGVGVLAFNLSLFRLLLSDTQELLVLNLFALQLSALGAYRSARPRKPLWIGIILSLVACFFSTFLADAFPTSLIGRVLSWYLEHATNYALLHLPTRMSDYYDEHQGQLFALTLFGAEMLVALGVTALVAGTLRSKS